MTFDQVFEYCVRMNRVSEVFRSTDLPKGSTHMFRFSPTASRATGGRLPLGQRDMRDYVLTASCFAASGLSRAALGWNPAWYWLGLMILMAYQGFAYDAVRHAWQSRPRSVP
jgi:hypothetical protein